MELRAFITMFTIPSLHLCRAQLTPSLPQLVKFPGFVKSARTRLQTAYFLVL